MNLLKAVLKRKLTIFALPMICVILMLAVFAPLISSHPPDAIDLDKKLLPPGSDHLLGTDHLGRDIFSRLIWGARVSMGSVAIIIVLVMLLSMAVGCTAGYLGGWIDSFCMRICEIFLTFPTFILAMFLIGVLGTGMRNVIIAIVLTHWAWYARIIRSLVLSLKNREYILASRVAGSSNFNIILHHLVPPVMAQLIILATLDIGHMMLHVSGLSFLGLGVQPPTPEWGGMINDARQYIWTRPELVFYPGATIFLAVLAFNLPGDALRDCLDPTIAAEE